MLFNHKYRKQRGIWGGSIEVLLLYLAIGLIVTLGVGRAYVALAKSKTNAEWDTIDGVAAAMRDEYPGQAYPTGDDSADLISNHKLGNIRTDGSVTIYGSTGQIVPTGAGATFTVSDPGLSYDICVGVLTSMPATGYSQVTVNGTAITNFRIITDQAKPLCTQAGNSNTIVVTSQ